MFFCLEFIWKICTSFFFFFSFFKLKIQQGGGGRLTTLHFFGFYHEDLLLKCLHVYPHGHYSFKDKFSFHSFYYVEQHL